MRPAGRERAQARAAGATYETIISDYYTQYGAFPTSIYRGGMSVPGAWRASMILSDILGGVPWDAYRREADGINSVINPTPLFLEQPNPPDIRMTTFSSWALDLIWEGNAVGIVAARNAAGWPTAAWAVPSRDVGIRRVSETGMPIGAIEYNVGGMVFDSADVVHIKGPCEPGALRGMGVLEAHMKTLTLAGAQADQSSGLANHGVPTGVLTVDNPDLKAQEAKAIKAQWLLDQATRSISVLNSTTHFEALAWNPQEIQLIEARQFTNSELALIFGVPPRLLNVAVSSQSLTYCVDTETEILTADGWKRYDAVSTTDTCLTLNQATGMAEWQQVDAVNVFGGPHDVVRMRSQTHSSLTTANHRWPTFPQSGVGMVPKWRWRTTEQLNSGDRILAAAPVAEVPTEAKWSDAMAELVGWFWTEGHIEPGGAVRISQSLAVNSVHVDRIRAALTSVFGPPCRGTMGPAPGGVPKGPAWSEYVAVGGRMAVWRINAVGARLLLDVAPNRVMSMEFLASLTVAQLELLIQVSIWADGSVTNSGTQVIAQRDLARLEAFQLACLLAGRAGTIRQHQSSAMWAMSVHKNPWRKPAGHAAHVSRERIDGPVWCPTTRNGTWLARRDGTTYYTGNTNLEQDDINILRYSAGGHLARFEGTLSAHMPRGTVAKANLDARLRPDTKTRYESHAIGIEAGFLLKNEARALEDLKPVPGLDDRPEQLPAPRPAIKATATVDEAKAIEE